MCCKGAHHYLAVLHGEMEIFVMTIDEKEVLKSIIESISRIDYIKPEDIPSIPLYMEQVTTFMDSQLNASRRYPEDKILTKTMINNYTKNNLIPPPDKKKYSKEHLLLMIFIYYFKNILSISDIQTLLHPITDKYFHAKKKPDLISLYQEVFSLEESQVDRMIKNILQSYHKSQDTFMDYPDEDREFLQQFAFICMLSFDVYVKKQIIEKMVDQMSEKKQTQYHNKASGKSGSKNTTKTMGTNKKDKS